jgi:poly(3-hydroxybutyrate) depolymerase
MRSLRIGASLAALLVSSACCARTSAGVIAKTATIAGTTVEYKVVLPTGYDSAKTYPGILAMPPGDQSMHIVDEVLRLNWRDQAEKRGYILVIPAAPNDQLFFLGGERIFPAFIEMILHDYKIQGGKFHIAGMSNGGISAFYIASLYPQYFLSITGFPGYLPDLRPAQLRAVSDMCIHMYVGSLDEDWLYDMQRQYRQLSAAGLHVTFAIEDGQPHRIATLAGAGASRLFDNFDADQRGCSK